MASSNGRPLVVTWESDTSGVKQGAEEVVRTVEQSEQRVDQVQEQAAQQRAARAEQAAQTLQDMFGINSAQEFAAAAEQAVQLYVDTFLKGLEDAQGRISAGFEAAFNLKPGEDAAAAEFRARLEAIGGGDYEQGVLKAQQLGLTTEQIMTAEQSMLGNVAAAGAATGPYAGVGLMPLALGPGALIAALGSWLGNQQSTALGRAGQAGAGFDMGPGAKSYEAELLERIAQNTSGLAGGGDFPGTTTYPTGG